MAGVPVQLLVLRGAAAAAQEEARRRDRHRHAAEPAGVEARRRAGRPAEAALAADAVVAATAATGVLVVGHRVAVRAAAAPVARRAAPEAAAGIAARRAVRAAGVGDRAAAVVERRGRREHQDRRARDSLPLRAVGIVARAGEVDGPARGARAVVRVRAEPRRRALRAATAEAAAVHVDRLAVPVERAGDVERDDAPGGAVPRRRRHGTGDGGAGVLRHPDHLEAALALHRVRVGVGIGIGQRGRERKDAGRNGPGRDRVLEQARVVERGVALSAAGAAVGTGVRRVDGGILDLDHEEQVAGRDGRGRAAPVGPADGDRERAGPRGARGGVVGVDDAGDARVARRAGHRADLRVGRAGQPEPGDGDGEGGKQAARAHGAAFAAGAPPGAAPRPPKTVSSNLKRSLTYGPLVV